MSAPEPARMKFADVCALVPEGVYWGDRLTPQMARELVEAGIYAERKRAASPQPPAAEAVAPSVLDEAYEEGRRQERERWEGYYEIAKAERDMWYERYDALMKRIVTDYASLLPPQVVTLAAAPAPQPQPLSAQQVDALIESHVGGGEISDDEYSAAVSLIRAAELAHGIGTKPEITKT